MALALDPETGQVTTTHLLIEQALDRKRDARLQEINRQVIEDAVKWRSLPEYLRREWERKWKK